MRRVALVTCGSSSDVKPFVELTADLGVLPRAADGLLDARDNGIYFRANYARALVIWCGICAVRHPFYTFWLAIVLGAAFHALAPHPSPRPAPPATIPVAAASAAGGQSPTPDPACSPDRQRSRQPAHYFCSYRQPQPPVWLLLPPLSLALPRHAAEVEDPPRRRRGAAARNRAAALSLHAALRAGGRRRRARGRERRCRLRHRCARSDVMSRRVEAIRAVSTAPRCKRNVD